MAQFAHQASGIEVSQPIKQKLAEIKQANIQPSGADLESQRKKKQGKKECMSQKCNKILKHSSSLKKNEKKCRTYKQNPHSQPFFRILDELLVEINE